MQQDDILPTKGRVYGHVIFLNFAVCRDAARRAGLSATAELLVKILSPTDLAVNL